MKLKQIGSNQTEVQHQQKVNGGVATVAVLYSYETPVAYTVTWPDGGSVARKTNKFYSRTTSKHINAWLPSNHMEVDQAEVDKIAGKVE